MNRKIDNVNYELLSQIAIISIGKINGWFADNKEGMMDLDICMELQKEALEELKKNYGIKD